MKLTLRGHHLLCLKGFQGYGYDSNFIKNMNHINEKRKLKNTIITITNNHDDICKSCPNLKDDLCINKKENQKIIKMDNEVISKLKISNDENGITIFKKVNEVFNTKESVSKICFNCKWHEQCLFYQNLD